MFGSNMINSSLNIGKIISGLSKGLTIANQVIPLYQQSKPLIQNTRKVISAFKSVTDNKPKQTIDIKPNKKTELVYNNTSNPVFFQ